MHTRHKIVPVHVKSSLLNSEVVIIFVASLYLNGNQEFKPLIELEHLSQKIITIVSSDSFERYFCQFSSWDTQAQLVSSLFVNGYL